MIKPEDDVLGMLESVRTEAEGLKARLERGQDAGEIKKMREELSARFQLIEDEAQNELAEQFSLDGSLSGIKACEINNRIDKFSLTLEDVDRLLEQYGGHDE